MTTVAPCVVSLIACLLCSSPCLRVDKHMIQIDVPLLTLRPPDPDLSVPLPPDVRSSICLAHLSSPRGCRRVQPFLPMLTKWWGVRFARSPLRTGALCSNRTFEERVQNIGNLVMGVTTRSIVLIDCGLIPMHDLDRHGGVTALQKTL